MYSLCGVVYSPNGIANIVVGGLMDLLPQWRTFIGFSAVTSMTWPVWLDTVWYTKKKDGFLDYGDLKRKRMDFFFDCGLW